LRRSRMARKSGKLIVTAIVPSAGKGTRFEGRKGKIFADLKRRPLLFYSLKALESSPLIKDIVLVTDRRLLKAAKALVRRYSITKVRDITEGGRERSESVRRGLRLVDKKTDLVLVHDGVRPFVSKGVIKKTVAAAKRFGASVSAVPVKATIKASGKDLFVKYTPDRKTLWEAQTPQVFRKDLLEEAFRGLKRSGSFTDDAALIEKIGKRVKIVRGDYNNIKVTTAEDIKIAEALLDN